MMRKRPKVTFGSDADFEGSSFGNLKHIAIILIISIDKGKGFPSGVHHVTFEGNKKIIAEMPYIHRDNHLCK
jgi:hypothetical protein